jgi:predicted glycoside hydrolase/deacetylase ChbG (UPF0249 family)
MLVKNIAELCGFAPDSKLLILHADDFGMCRSVNRAIFAAFEDHAISSASVMVPCPAFPEAAEWCGLHPQYDVGIHSTLLSEWERYKWGPVSKKAHSDGLVDAEGYFWPQNALLRATPAEVEDEICAQILLARNRGINPTHLDTHMFAAAHPEYVFAYITSGRKFALPALMNKYWDCYCASRTSMSDSIVVDDIMQAPYGESPQSLEKYYISALKGMKAGLNQLLLHPGHDDEELRAITGDCKCFGAAWRQRDFEIVTSDRFKSALRENQIHVINWHSVKCAMSRQQSLLPEASL